MWRTLRSPSALLVAAAVGACGGDAPSGPTPVATVNVAAVSLAVAVGESTQLTARTYDARAVELTGRAVVWASGNVTIATVTQAGIVTALSPGAVAIEATSEGKRGQLTLTVLAPAPPVSVRGQLFTIEGLLPGPLTAALRVGAGSSTPVTVTADGRFDLTSTAQGDVVDLVVDGASGAYLPSLVRFPRSAVPFEELRILLAPRRWTIPAGTHASRTIDVSANLAFGPPCATPGDTNCDGFYPKAWATGIKLWDEATLPAPLAFDHARTSSPVSAEDSVAFWEIVRRMEADMGRPLFRPATAAELSVAADGWSSGAVMVRVDASLPPGRAFTNWRWDSRGAVFAAVVRAGSVAGLGSGSLVTHELLHAIGLKHSCGWVTVMGGYGCPSASGLTPEDVGYARVALRLAEIQRAMNAYRNLYEAMQGERVLLLGLPPASLTLMDALGLPAASRVGGEDGAH
jgi:hypothetical protein